MDHCLKQRHRGGLPCFVFSHLLLLICNRLLVVSYNPNESTFGMNSKNGDIYHPVL